MRLSISGPDNAAAARRAQSAARAPSRPRVRRHAAEKAFFPAATVYGGLAVPLSVHGMLSGQPLLPGFGTVQGHAHELLFGFALAVMAGYLISRTRGRTLVALMALWLAARASFLVAPESLLAPATNTAFAVMLATLVAPQFLKGAKKLRNKAFAPLLIALCLAPVAFHIAGRTPLAGLQFLALQEAVVLFTLLMLFMGGRIIAPAAAGAIERSGGHLEARVQPRLEAALLITMLGVAVSLAIPGARPIAGLLAFAAAGIALVRLLRWRLWACRGRPDLWCLGIGYGWLVAGLAMMGSAWLFLALPEGTATHAITVGALGTLTTAVMARVRLVRNRLDPSQPVTLPVITCLIGAAALVRVVADSPVALMVASASWSLAFALLLVILVRVPPR